ncbi:ABC transporter permease [Pectobacteriaceae bacterium CE70]|uniref:ABC transporter permease n=1 Tax=Serratia sp. (strain ATCC 39006) TaxID=104623 RepID=A0A2I5T3V9_SERS3|nr:MULTISPECIES: ABC transporter permease [Enterobacterales]WJV62161.1 ABC transporter permease [Pectobacteriaceae bacterium C52]WJV66441.1 ABC transporter permease [Pectobacteriaceae bacterium CE70]WJY10447.1 ABC transporter permease [Pectobacteriaceae bacterium C80]AUG99249.1 ABC transporter permease [Serratia sp. ATCC 39006]AUH03566.1 ABC transporter permease [Serratia sp. ATCC 39006]
MPPLKPSVVLGLLALGIFICVALLAPWIAPYPADKIIGGAWLGPMGNAWMGTDNLGRDLFSRLIWGTRTSLSVTALAAALAFLLGTSLGFLAGVCGGWVDQLISRVNDVLMAIPTLIFALVVLAMLPKNTAIIILVLGVLEATRVLRVSRSLAVDIATQEFIEVARMRGESMRWILWREILPNALTTLVAEFALRFIFILLFLSALSFLGMGIQPPTADWGGLARDNKDGILFGVWAALVPGAAIALLAVSLNVVADWLLSRDGRNWHGGKNG